MAGEGALGGTIEKNIVNKTTNFYQELDKRKSVYCASKNCENCIPLADYK